MITFTFHFLDSDVTKFHQIYTSAKISPANRWSRFKDISSFAVRRFEVEKDF